MPRSSESHLRGLGSRVMGHTLRTAGLIRLAIATAVVAGVISVVVAGSQWDVRRSTDRGVRLLGAGDYASAARALLHRVASAPNDARAHYYLGLAYSRMGVREGAINHFRVAVRLAPTSAESRDGLGRALREAGETPAALAELEEAVRLNPREPRYQIDLAGALLDQGQVGPAVAGLRRAIQARPDALELRLLLATALARAGDREGRARQYREVSRLAGENPLGEMARQDLRLTELNERSPR